MIDCFHPFPDAHYEGNSMMVQITTLIENTVQTRSLKAEHGLSFHIKVGKNSLLFDTGQSDLLLENASKLGIDLTQLDAIVLSHGHYDHTSGLETLLTLAPKARIFLHPGALDSKYVREITGSCRRIGMPLTVSNTLATATDKITFTEKKTEILPGFFATGNIPRVTPFENPEQSFFNDDAATNPDNVPDDQALYFNSREGIVVILGCAHAGVINTLEHISKLTDGKPFYALLGGMHLIKADKTRIDATVEALRKFNFKKIAPAHCTGLLATSIIWTTFVGACDSCSTGTRFTFQI